MVWVRTRFFSPVERDPKNEPSHTAEGVKRSLLDNQRSEDINRDISIKITIKFGAFSRFFGIR
jgi:hypothetical protein